jgi:hypothetical protein
MTTPGREMPARAVGSGESVGNYVVADDQMAAGSTFGAPRLCMTIKASGAIEKIYSVDAGEVLFGTLVLHFWDRVSGTKLEPMPGRFVIHPEHQEHLYELPNHVGVHETLFALSCEPVAGEVGPPAAYYRVVLHNEGPSRAVFSSYAICQLRGHTSHDVMVSYDDERRAFIAWNVANPQNVRLFGVSVDPAGYETTTDHDKALSFRHPVPLANRVDTPPGQDTLGIFELAHELEAGESAEFFFKFALSAQSRADAEHAFDDAPRAAEALECTRNFYRDVLGRSILMTPDDDLNRGVLWAKANMLRTILKPRTGWSFVNDPTRSNNSVGRDTAWFGYGADFVLPDIAEAALLAYVELQEPSGMIVEYYDIRNNATADYDLNINDNTPLIVLALLHHYQATGDEAFLERVYPAAIRAARYILSQRDERGLIWCKSTKTSDWGIVGWRNVIQGYRLSGATTELNSECYGALGAISKMARALGKAADEAEFAEHAARLHDAIHEHLYNADNDLYYLNIDVDGRPRSDVTVDLVFPIIFGVADDDMAARIVSRLSAQDFWTDAGIRTVPRGAPDYGATHGYGLLGGVWVGATFWFAFAAARFNADLMARSLADSFVHYSRDPRKNNTVPGQFSEWLHGETLVNQGMMLSPWFPPRYVWSAVEGVAGIDISTDPPGLEPRMPPGWGWYCMRNLPFRGRALTWAVVRTPELRVYANVPFARPGVETFTEDISHMLRLSGGNVVAIGLRRPGSFAVLMGNPTDHTVAAALSVDDSALSGTYAVHVFNSLRSAWIDDTPNSAERLRAGVPFELERKGFCIVECTAIEAD